MKYILPNFYDFSIDNHTIISQFLYQINWGGIQGNFPFHILNGGPNNIIIEELALAEDVLSSVSNYSFLSNRVLIDCGNTEIKPADYTNCFSTVIFDAYAKLSNVYFEISSMDFADFLVNKYPSISLVIHQNFINTHTEDEIQTFINRYPDNIKSIIITPNNECINITNIEKIYLIPFSFCFCCPQLQHCLKIDNTMTLEYSEHSQFNTCLDRQLMPVSDIMELINRAKNYTDIILFESFLYASQMEEYHILEQIIKECSVNDKEI